jgi:hypothetical protein
MMLPGYYLTTSPMANLGPTELILTFTWSPGLVCGMKTTKPSILATPSPRRLVSLMSSSYSFPSSTGLLMERSKLIHFTSFSFVQLVLREKSQTSTRMVTVGRSLQPVHLTKQGVGAEPIKTAYHSFLLLLSKKRCATISMRTPLDLSRAHIQEFGVKAAMPFQCSTSIFVWRVEKKTSHGLSAGLGAGGAFLR